MPTTFRPYEPDQLLPLAPDMQEWLPEGHLAHHVSDLVDELDLTVFHAPYEGDGRRNAPYEPRMMVKVLLYGYATGVFSSRGLRGGWRRTWRSGCWERGTFRATARFAGSAVGTWRTSGVCLWRWCGWPAGGTGALREAVGGRDEGACERKQT